MTCFLFLTKLVHPLFSERCEKGNKKLCIYRAVSYRAERTPLFCTEGFPWWVCVGFRISGVTTDHLLRVALVGSSTARILQLFSHFCKALSLRGSVLVLQKCPAWNPSHALRALDQRGHLHHVEQHIPAGLGTKPAWFYCGSHKGSAHGLG